MEEYRQANVIFWLSTSVFWYFSRSILKVNIKNKNIQIKMKQNIKIKQKEILIIYLKKLKE